MQTPKPLFLLAPALSLALVACVTPPGTGDTKTAAANPSASAASVPARAASGPAGAASGARPAAPTAGPPLPGQPLPFATVIKDAKKIDGLFTLWTKDDKVWIELAPEDFGKLYMLSPKISQGIGEGRLFGGTMVGRWGSWGRTQLVEFRKFHSHVQMLARNTDYIAPDKSPEGHAVAVAFSPSLIGSAAVGSAPHPERKSILVEANSLFMTDMLGLGMALQRNYRQNYSFDGRHSTFNSVRGKPDGVFFDVRAHFATPNILMLQPGMPPGLVPSVPATLPDVRSLFFGLHYSLSKLPDQPMAARRADPRVGYFSTTVFDFADDLARTPKQRMVNRWRLEKKDPAAELSEPVKPITFWLDKTVPMKYREAIAKGVTGWNAAFEKIGFKNAVVAKIQPDDADFDTLDVGIASIRWMTNAQPSFGAIGPSQVDPRTGEILDADIGFESLSSRAVRTIRAQLLAGRQAHDWAALMQFSAPPDSGLDGTAGAVGQAPRAVGMLDHSACQHADFAAEQLSYALDVLEARGELDPNGPEAQQWVQDYLTDTTLHEVGHTLGLRHNFRSSRIYTDQQMSDSAFTKANGLAGSVMEYAPINLPRPGEPGGHPFQLVLGPYDYWAIEYAYKPIPVAQEAAELQRIAARSAEPQLAYGTDEDSFLGIDPEALQFDLGNDPLVFAQKRVDIARDLIKRQATRELRPDEDYSVLRRSVMYALRDAARAVGVLARQIGGLRTLRDFPGTGRDPLQPVAADVQRQALEVIARAVLAADSIVLPASLQRRLAPDFQERGEALFDGASLAGTDLSVAAMLADLQRALLNQLMSDSLAQRILDSQGKVDNPAQAFTLSELYGRLSRDIWSDLAARDDIAAPRRELQREHVNRLAAVLLRPAAMSRADARSLLRAEAQALLTKVDTATRRAGLSAESIAHLKDSADTLREALAAKLQRSGA